MRAPSHFFRTYGQNRQNFLDGCRAAGARLTACEHPLHGPGGESCGTDIARFPGSGERVLVICAGTHGVEGFCGSAIQSALLHDGVAHSLDPAVTLVLVHALNPYGYAWLRRTDHQNVDLNRNFIDHSRPYPTNPAYAEIHGMLVPGDWDGPLRKAADENLEAYRKTRGSVALQAALSAGQYDFADGLFYGGRTPSWSNRVWHEVLTEHCAEARFVAVMDIHSGLGAPGACEFISNSAPDSEERRLAALWFGDRIVVPGVDSTATAAGGDLGRSLGPALPGVRAAAVVAEFGTREFDCVFAALRADNWIHAHSQPDSPVWARVKSEMLDAFMPSDAAWMSAVTDQGVAAVRRVASALAST